MYYICTHTYISNICSKYCMRRVLWKQFWYDTMYGLHSPLLALEVEVVKSKHVSNPEELERARNHSSLKPAEVT